MQKGELVEEVRSRIGRADARAAERAIVATLAALGTRLMCVDAERVAQSLPRQFATALCGGRRDDGIDLRGFYRLVARREGVAEGDAVDHAHAVCASLMKLLDEQARAQFRIHLWPELLVGGEGVAFSSVQLRSS